MTPIDGHAQDDRSRDASYSGALSRLGESGELNDEIRHHIQERAAYFERTQRYLKPGGRVAIVEYKPRGFFQRIFPHSTEGADIVSEMESAGYRLERDHDFLERQSFLVFAPDES